MYVIRNLKRPLLGRPAIEALKIVSLVEPVSESNIAKQFPRLFKRLGKMEGYYEIRLKDDVKPFALSTPRGVALPLLSKVKAELQQMENIGVITKIDEPTDWCAGIVVVPKPNDKVRICVDLTKLNKSVKRERHILPSVEQTLAQIGTAKYFTKFDANSGYWQVELHPNSRKLTMFITPFGRFYFNRLPFGITSTPEHFQRRMTEILGDISGVMCLVDDILVTGKTQDEHNSRLTEVLTRLEKAKVILGLSKCKFSQPSVKFLGQMVASSYGLGAVIRQVQPDGSLRPIAYASRALTETEQRYAQIEKEALTTTWACERFQQYLLGKSFKIETPISHWYHQSSHLRCSMKYLSEFSDFI